MKNGTLNLTLRNVKLAFIVDISDKKAVLEAIRINSLLWGGVYNPIIPYFERKPKILARDFLISHEDNKKILLGYLNAYDPDFVIQLGKCASKELNLGGREKISVSEILSGIKDDGTVGYGIGIYEVLNHFYQKELKFIRRHPFKIIKPKFSAGNRLFLSSVFGELPEEYDKEFVENYKDPFDLKTPTCNLENFHKFLNRNTLFLRRFTAMYIDAVRYGSRFRDRLLFLMNPKSLVDIIDYWNLRALGITILPIPIQTSKTEEIKKLCYEFIDESFGQSKYNAQIFHTATLQKSRAVTEGEIKAFIDFLKVEADSKSGQAKISCSVSYPRIWDDWARDKDGVDSPHLESETSEKDLSGDFTNINFRALTPKFMSRFGGHGTPRFANEIELRIYGDTETVAEVMPHGDTRLANRIGGYGHREWRLSKKGLVYLSEHAKWNVQMPIPKAELVFLDWMKSLGWKEAKISSAGHIGNQLIKHLGGIWGLETIRNEKLLELLGKLTGQDRLLASLSPKIDSLAKLLKSKKQEDASQKLDEFLKEIEQARQAAELKEGPILHEHLLDEISKAISSDKFKKDPKRYLERLTKINMFRLGVLIRCPICQKNSWYSLTDLNYELLCPKCLENFVPPVHSPINSMQWAYRPFGPFSLPNLALGSYSTLLTLRFFSKELNSAVTPSMSFVIKKDTNSELEVDLGMLFKSSEFGNSTVIPIFCECKSFWDKFEEKELKKLENLGKQIPGAILVFSTFRKSLTVSEKLLLTALVKRSRKNRTTRKPFNQIMILTGTELFAEFGPPDCWENGTDEQKKFAKIYPYDDIEWLCDVTQQIYLGLKSWGQEASEHYDNKRKKREQKKLLLSSNK